MRHIGILFAVAVSFVPASAFACGMYIPPEHEELLTELFDEIDQAAVVVEQPSVAQIAEATAINEANDVPVAVEPVESTRPHHKLFNRNNTN